MASPLDPGNLRPWLNLPNEGPGVPDEDEEPTVLQRRSDLDDLGTIDDEDERTDAAPGRGGRLVAGRYAVAHTIAQGGFGEVLLARHVDLGRHVALKVTRPPQGEHRIDFTERFRTEARTLAGFDHPNIVRVHDFGVLDDGRCFLAMEYVEGEQLATVLKRGPLPATRALALAAQICHALRYAHERGVIHRDLTPSNLMIKREPDGTEIVKLLDFGIAKVDRPDAEETQDVVLGSPHVMAPEQIEGREVDPRTDIYALGVVLFRMLTGVYPFRGKDATAILLAHLDQPVPRFHEVAPDVDVPEGIEAIVRRCLAKDPADRWPDASTLLDELANVMDVPSGAWRTPSSLAIPPPAVARVRVPPDPAPTLDEVPEVPERGRVPWGLVAVAGLLGMAGVAIAGVALGLAVGGPAPADPGTAEPPPALAAPPVEAETEAPAEPPQAEPPAPAAPAKKAAAPTDAKAAPKRAEPPKTTPPQRPASSEPAPAPARAPKGYQGLPRDY